MRPRARLAGENQAAGRRPRRGDDGRGGERLRGDVGRADLAGDASSGISDGPVGRSDADRREHASCGGRRKHRPEDQHVGAPLGNRGSECGADRTVTEVCADSPAAQHPAVAVGDDPLGLLAVHRTPLGHLHQRPPRLEDRLLGCTGRDTEGQADLRMGQAGQLPHDERAALALRQLVQVGDEHRQPLSLVRRVMSRVRRLELV
jgi:hypothetical protein